MDNVGINFVSVPDLNAFSLNLTARFTGRVIKKASKCICSKLTLQCVLSQAPCSVWCTVQMSSSVLFHFWRVCCLMSLIRNIVHKHKSKFLLFYRSHIAIIIILSPSPTHKLDPDFTQAYSHFVKVNMNPYS